MAAMWRGRGGIGPRRLDRSYDSPSNVIAPGQTGVFRGRQVIISSSGAGTGLFEYQGFAGPGNPPILWAVAPGVTKDPFGNALPVNGGVVSEAFGGGLFAQLLAGQVIFGDTLSADPLTSGGLMRLLHMVAHGNSPIIAIDSPAADANASHTSLWMLGAPQGYTSGPLQTAIFAFQGASTQLPLEHVFALGPGGRLSFGSILPSGVTPSTFMWLAPSGDTSGLTDANAVQNGFNVSGYKTIVLLPGQWYFKAGTIAMFTDMYLRGCGKSATVINGVDNGVTFKPVVSIHNVPGVYAVAKNVGVSDFKIDNSAQSFCNGIEFGDVVGVEIREIDIINCPNGTGLYGNNKQFFTEQWRGNAYVQGGFNALALDANGGTNSFDRPDFTLWVNAFDTGNGVHLLGGATGIQVGEGVFNLFGNFSSGATGGGCAVLIDQANSNFLGVNFNIGVETDSVGPNFPQTMKFATATSQIVSCYGSWAFSAGRTSNFRASNNNGNVQFDGKILGDDTLRAKQLAPDAVTITPTAPLGGNVFVEKLGANGKVFVKFAFNIPAGQTLAAGQQICPAFTDPFFLHIDNVIVTLWANGGGLNQAASAIISNTGTVTNNGPALAAVGSTCFVYGQATYSNSY